MSMEITHNVLRVTYRAENYLSLCAKSSRKTLRVFCFLLTFVACMFVPSSAGNLLQTGTIFEPWPLLEAILRAF